MCVPMRTRSTRLLTSSRGNLHLGAFFDAVVPVLAAVTQRLGRTLGSV